MFQYKPYTGQDEMRLSQHDLAAVLEVYCGRLEGPPVIRVRP